MTVLIFLAKALGAYIVIGLLFWALFKKEIRARKNLNVYNFLMKDRNKYLYLYRQGGATVSILLTFYLIPYLFSMRRLVLKVVSEKREKEFIEEWEDFILANKDSPHLIAIDRKKTI